MAKKSDKENSVKTKADAPVSVKRYIALVRKQADEDMKRHLGALVEHVDDRIAAISEQFVDFDRKLDTHEKRFDRIDEKLDSHTEMIGMLAEDVAIIKENVEFLKDSLKKKVDYEEFVALERRVRLMETKLR